MPGGGMGGMGGMDFETRQLLTALSAAEPPGIARGLTPARRRLSRGLGNEPSREPVSLRQPGASALDAQRADGERRHRRAEDTLDRLGDAVTIGAPMGGQ